MSTIKQNHADPCYATATGSTLVQATINGIANQTIFITDISASSVKLNSTLQALNGSTVIWQENITTGQYEHSFVQPIQCSVGTTFTLSVTGATLTNVNCAGFYVHNS